MGILSALLPKDPKFFTMFEEVAANFRTATELLRQLATSSQGEARSNLVRRIKEVEHLNDDVTHRIFDELHKTFITPFDREDIHSLTSSLDDVLDYLNSIAERIEIFRIDVLTEEMKELMSILARSMDRIAEIVDSLRNLKKQGALDEHNREIHTLENDGDATYMRALGALFDRNTDPIDVIRWKDLYQMVESAIDRCENVANVTEGIAIKHA